MRPPKFSFVAEEIITPKHSDFQYTVTITGTGALYFPKEVIEVNKLAGKFIKLYGDITKKAIAWKIIQDQTNMEELKNVRQLKPMESTGAAQVSARKILSAIGVSVGEGGIERAIKDIPVGKYDGSMLEDSLYYIELTPEMIARGKVKKEEVSENTPDENTDAK